MPVGSTRSLGQKLRESQLQWLSAHFSLEPGRVSELVTTDLRPKEQESGHVEICEESIPGRERLTCPVSRSGDRRDSGVLGRP